jgi:DNA-directed RNA polymerase alpha subunit
MDARGRRATSRVAGIENGQGFDRPETEANRYGHKHSIEDSEGQDEMTERHLIDPTPGLPDNTRIEDVRFPTRIRNILTAAGLKTVGEVRETPDKTLLTFADVGQGSVSHLRKTLGLPSRDGVRPR